MLKKITFILFFVLIVSQTKGQTVDQRMLNHLTKNVSRSEYHFWNGVSNSGIVLVGGVPAVQWVRAIAAKNPQFKKDAYVTTGALLINTAFTWGLKYSINRKRPDITFPFPTHKPTDPSFPSGHTSYSFATATALALEYKKWYVAVPAYTWASAIGFSRLKLGVHYPSDVLGGIVIGAGSAYLSYKLNAWLHKNRK